MINSIVSDRFRYSTVLRGKRIVRGALDMVKSHVLSIATMVLVVGLAAERPWDVSGDVDQYTANSNVEFLAEKGGSFQLAFWQEPAASRVEYLQNAVEKVVRDPKALFALVGGDVNEILQRPDLERREMGVVVWQYRTDSCVVDFYFDTGVGTTNANIDGLPIDYYEIRERQVIKLGQSDEIAPAVDAQKGQSACLANLVVDRADDPAKVKKLAALVGAYRG